MLPLAVDRACGDPARVAGAEAVTTLFADRVFAGQPLAWAEVVDLPPSDPVALSGQTSLWVHGGREALWLAWMEWWEDAGTQGLVLQQVDPVTGAVLADRRGAVPVAITVRTLTEVGGRKFLEDDLELSSDAWVPGAPPWRSDGFWAAATSRSDETWALAWRSAGQIRTARVHLDGTVSPGEWRDADAVRPERAVGSDHAVGILSRSDGAGVLVTQPVWIVELRDGRGGRLYRSPGLHLLDPITGAAAPTPLPASLLRLDETQVHWWAPDAAMLGDGRLVLRGQVWRPDTDAAWPLLIVDPVSGAVEVIEDSCGLSGDVLTVGGQPALVEQFAPGTEATLTRLGW